MTVRKKISTITVQGGSMDLSRELEQVRATITDLPTDEGAVMETATENTATPASTKKPAKKTPAKKPAVKKPAKPEVEMVALADICKPFKIDPRMGRRYLRNAKLKNPGRWAWPKGDAGIKKATDAIKAATTDEK